MYYFGLICGLPVGFLAAVAFPGVIARLRSGYFSKVHRAEQYGKSVAGQVQKGI